MASFIGNIIRASSKILNPRIGFGISRQFLSLSSVATNLQKRSLLPIPRLNVVNERQFFGYNAVVRLNPKETLFGREQIFDNHILRPGLCPSLLPTTHHIQSRSLLQYSHSKGKRKTDKEVIRRFKRLDWGIWIRAKAGAKRQLWRKSAARKNRLKQIVFCNSTQSRMLDKMVTSYWRKPRVYPDDPYQPYLKRENFHRSRYSPQES